MPIPIRRRFRRRISRIRRKFFRSRRRLTNRTPSRPILSRAINSAPVTFKRKFLLATSNIGTTNWSNAYTFSITDIADYTRYQEMYDWYKITTVVLEFVYRHNSSDISGINQYLVPIIHSAPDYNDNNSPGSVDELLNKGGYRRKRMLGTCKYVVRPATRTAVYNSADPSINLGNYSEWRKWQNFETPNTPYYGYKFFIQHANTGTSTTSNFEVYATYYFKCKDPK